MFFEDLQNLKYDFQPVKSQTDVYGILVEQQPNPITLDFHVLPVRPIYVI